MLVLRGREPTIEADRVATTAMIDGAVTSGREVLRVWRPHKHVAFGRRDAHSEGYERARSAVESRGYPAIERRVGGRAVAHTGQTLAFAHARPVEESRSGLEGRYRATARTVATALETVGASIDNGEPEATFCPGDHSLQVAAQSNASGKVCGLAQRITADAALVAGCLIVRESDAKEVATVLDRTYAKLDVPFDPSTVGSVHEAGGPTDPTVVARALEDAFLDGRESKRLDVRQWNRRQ